jgi:hypothetical protein
MNKFAKELQSKRIFKQVLNANQKGYKRRIEWCAEHAATLKYLTLIQWRMENYYLLPH